VKRCPVGDCRGEACRACERSKVIQPVLELSIHRLANSHSAWS
jgi:hypothetical protein